jgi:hypothetical protein
VVPAGFHEFFSACASVAGALIGLLFVAVSVAPEKLTGDSARADHQVRAAAAFSALVNTLVIALVALLPGASLGEAGIGVAIAGLVTTVGLGVVLRREGEQMRRADVIMLALLLVLYALELANATQLDHRPHDTSAISAQGGLAIAFFVFGIARSWQLVGARNLGLVSAMAAAIQRSATEPPPRPKDDHTGTATPAPGQDNP